MLHCFYACRQQISISLILKTPSVIESDTCCFFMLLFLKLKNQRHVSLIQNIFCVTRQVNRYVNLISNTFAMQSNLNIVNCKSSNTHAPHTNDSSCHSFRFNSKQIIVIRVQSDWRDTKAK